MPSKYDGDVAFERTAVDPERMGGVPCIRDVRIAVSVVLGQPAAGRTSDSPEAALRAIPHIVRSDDRR